MSGLPHPLADLSLSDRAALALRNAVAKAIQNHKQLGLPLAVWRNGQVTWISAEEAEAEMAATPDYPSAAPIDRPT
jgi:hypothetical protein